MVAWAESVGLEEFAQSLHGSGVHGGVIALDDSFDAEALAMAMKIPQHLHDVSDELPSLCLTHSTSHPLQVRRTVKLEFSALLASHPLQVRRTVKLEFSALLADGTSRVNSEVRVQYLL